MAEIIRFDDEKFLKLYHSPAESEYNNKRARMIYKACEIWHRIKEKKKCIDCANCYVDNSNDFQCSKGNKKIISEYTHATFCDDYRAKQ